jgi:hypothetical protein
MERESNGTEAVEEDRRRRVDWLAMSFGLATLVLVGGTAWLRFGPAARPEPPAVGSALPPLRLLNLDSSEPLVLLGLRGKVVWIAFWSASSSSGREGLARLEEVWKRLKPHSRFSMVAAAVETADPERVRAAVSAARATLPVYLAGRETCGRFGVNGADPPLHLLIDPQGRVAALARGAGRETIDRLASQARGWLDDIDPLRNTRFATTPAGPSPVPENPVVTVYRSR